MYHDIIQFIDLLEKEERNFGSSKDVASTHTAAETLKMLHEFFNEQIISI